MTRSRKVTIAAVLVAIIIATTLVVALANRGMCKYVGWQLNQETRYATFVGCLVKTGESWLPYKQMRYTE